jgi:hypothetical protein
VLATFTFLFRRRLHGEAQVGLVEAVLGLVGGSVRLVALDLEGCQFIGHRLDLLASRRRVERAGDFPDFALAFQAVFRLLLADA